MGHLPQTTFLSFGKPKELWRPILGLYEQRLARAGSFEHVILRERGERVDDVLSNAAKALDPHLGGGAFVLVFDERGKARTSKDFARFLASIRPQRLVAIVGTSHGLTGDVRGRADARVSLGPMTLPHEIARVVALEQLYRAETILAGHPYHHG